MAGKTPEGWSAVHLTAWGVFLPQKIGRARALEYLIGDQNGPRLDVNDAAAGPRDGWVHSGGAFDDGVLPASVAGSTALHEAGKKGNTLAIAALLKHGADPLLADSVGRLALHDAVEVDSEKQDETVSLLLEAGGDKSASVPDSDGDTALGLVKAILKRDKKTWDDLTEEERDGETFPVRFPSFLRLIDAGKAAKSKGACSGERSYHLIASVFSQAPDVLAGISDGFVRRRR